MVRTCITVAELKPEDSVTINAAKVHDYGMVS